MVDPSLGEYGDVILEDRSVNFESRLRADARESEPRSFVPLQALAHEIAVERDRVVRLVNAINQVPYSENRLPRCPIFRLDRDLARPRYGAKLDPNFGSAIEGILDRVLQELVRRQRDSVDDVGIAEEGAAEGRYEISNRSEQT